jgi:Fur family ferric uptake transcriptional regulator
MKVKVCPHQTHSSPFKERVDKALNFIRERKIRVTNPRKEILNVLAKATRPMSSDEVFSNLKKGSSDLVTVYRSLTTLEEIGLLRRHDLGDTVRRYELSEGNHHHHYVRCKSCGTVEAFEGCEFENKLSKTLSKKGYHMIQHSLDVMALCSSCHAS